MRLSITIGALGASLFLSACSGQEEAAMPSPFALTEEAMGRYCGMNVLEHAGPKGQIIPATHPRSHLVLLGTRHDRLHHAAGGAA